MDNMKQSIKKRILKEISETLIDYDKKYINHFLCPLCLIPYCIDNLNEISIAHIFPDSANGKITTWACRNCNSDLGKNVDKWFGQYLRIMQEKSLFIKNNQINSFSIDGIRINGEIKQSDHRIDLMIYKNRNSPYTNDLLRNELSKFKQSRELKFTIPLLGKLDTVDLGFITAAYFYGFSIFGYSWIMQAHFDSIREAISKRDLSYTKNVFISNIVNDSDDREHYFGLVAINNIYIPCIKLMTKVVFFSPYYEPNALELLRKKTQYDVEVKRLTSIPNKTYTKPFILTVGDKVIIYPNKGKNELPIKFVMLVDPISFNINILSAFIDDKIEKEILDSEKPIEKYSITLKSKKTET